MKWGELKKLVGYTEPRKKISEYDFELQGYWDKDGIFIPDTYYYNE